ncbi:MAG: glycoside hydrolase family 9 protein [Planctomycetes bacterium]|nr:glycoside hydrolase family 9 protein [Planctomycetota bacterium]
MRIHIFTAVLICFSSSILAQEATRPYFKKPTVVHVGLVAPDIVAVEISTDGWIPSRFEKYSKQDGDLFVDIKKDKHSGEVKNITLQRNGKKVGYIVGVKNDHVSFNQDNVCPPIQGPINMTGTWSVSGNTIKKVSHKAKPINWNDADRNKSPIHHFVYLHLARPLATGINYSIVAQGLNVDGFPFEFSFDEKTSRSEAVHVNQVGFRPDDPAKRAYVSVWLGTGGKYSYGKTPEFTLVDNAGKTVYSGSTVSLFSAKTKEYSQYGHNSVMTDVYQLDFADFKKKGTYTISVAGIGCSYPFDISDSSWETAFITSMRGFLNQRSGIELKAPYTDFIKPRDLHPADGVKIYATDVNVTKNVTKGNNFKQLFDGKGSETLEDAWGGWHDAGDWDRRYQHLWPTHKMLELADLFVDDIKNIHTNIPESKNKIPDVIDEALWNLDLFRRLQLADGSVRYGIESSSHPRHGEPSWLESLSVMAYGPDIITTYTYAATAARASFVLNNFDKKLAKLYKDSALKAMNYGEANYQSWKNDPQTKKNRHVECRDRRNHAALELYRLTEDGTWNDVFTSETWLGKMRLTNEHKKHNQGDAAFLYCLLKEELQDKDMAANAKKAIINTAEECLRYQTGMAYDVAHFTKYMPKINGFFSAPLFTEFARAHYLTNDEKYLGALIKASGFGLGANPMNMPLTTGIGDNPPQNPLFLDMRYTGQKAPEGITLYGIADIDWGNGRKKMPWAYQWFYSKQCIPAGQTWPVAEDYFDTYGFPTQNEYTVQSVMEYAAYNWGYLALRK